jgi:hypothetical protein
VKKTINEFNRMHQGLGNLFARSLPAKLQYYIARNAAILNRELQPYHETRQSLATSEKYNAEINREAQRFVFASEDLQQQFADEVDELGEEEIDIDLCPIKLEWLEHLDVMGSTMMAISPLIEA